MGLVAPKHVRSSWIRDQTRVSCTDRWTLYQESPSHGFLLVIKELSLSHAHTNTHIHTCTHTHTHAHTECSFLHLCFISIACPVQNAPPSCLLASLSHSLYETSSCPSHSEDLRSVPPSEAATTNVTCRAVDSGWFSSGRAESLLKAASDSEMARPALASRLGPSRV